MCYRNHDGAAPNWTYYRIVMSYSDNGSQSWQYLSTVAENVDDPNRVRQNNSFAPS